MAETTENNVQNSTNTLNDGEKAVLIENTVATFLQKAQKENKKFDETGFRSAAYVYLKDHNNLNGLNASAFLTEKEECFDCPGRCFKLKHENGKFTAIGSDGTILQGDSFEEINDKVCQNMKQASLAQGREPKIGYTGEDPQKQQIFAKAAILKHHMTIIKGGPKDPQFWQNLKQEFLADKNNSLELWEQLTRNIPDDVMLRTPEEMERNQKLLQRDGIDHLRGTNSFSPKTTPTMSAPVREASTTADTISNLRGTSRTANSPNTEMSAEPLPLPGISKENDREVITQMRMGRNPYIEPNVAPTPFAKHQLTPEMLRQLQDQQISK